MKRLLLAILLTLGMVGTAMAMECPGVVGPTTRLRCTETVFNDSGSALTPGTVVAWDDDDTDFSSTGYPYVFNTATADDPYLAGVILDNSCPDQALCTIVTRGLTDVLIANTTDVAAVDTLLSSSTVAGQAGDYGTGANACSLGPLVSFDLGSVDRDFILGRVFVNIDCD